MLKQKVCDIQELANLPCKSFVLKKTDNETEAFLVYFKGRYYAYENSCPHTGVNLNWQEDQFLSVDGLFIQCSLHGALFEPSNGMCVRGPCRGEQLKEIQLDIQKEGVFVVS